MTEAEFRAASREQLRMLEAAYQRSQSQHKWLRKAQPAPAPATPYFGPLFAEAPQ